MPRRPLPPRSYFEPRSAGVYADVDRATALAIARWMMAPLAADGREDAFAGEPRSGPVNVELLSAAIAVVRAAVEEECGQRAAEAATIAIDSEWLGDMRSALAGTALVREGDVANDPRAIVGRAEAIADMAAAVRVRRKLKTERT